MPGLPQSPRDTFSSLTEQHPNGAPPPSSRPDDAFGKLLAAAQFAAVEFGPPVKASAIDPTTPYVLDNFGRMFCGYGIGPSGPQCRWAYVGPYNTYWSDLFPIYLSDDPTQDLGARLSIIPVSKLTLCSASVTTSWDWAAFLDPQKYPPAQSPQLTLKATVGQTNPDGTIYYNLSYMSGSTPMTLAADQGVWNYVYVSSSASSAQFTFRKFFVNQAKVQNLFQATWPNASFTYEVFRAGDQYFEAIGPAQAAKIYQDSGLSAYTWTSEVFDCDDFSYVYKGQASKAAYAAKTEYGYAVGIIFGKSANDAHAVNVFIDTSGAVQILEPQSGTITPGAAWKDSQGSPYQPFFILM